MTTVENGNAGLLADYLTEQQAAAELGTSRRTLSRWYQLRTGPPRTRIGHRVFYSRASLAAWLRSREERPRRRKQ